MVNLSHHDMRISLLEKLVVNWAVIPDAIIYCMRSHYNPEQFPPRSLGEEVKGIWSRRIKKYHKLLAIKEIHSGCIPKRVIKNCFKSPCDYTRLMLAYFR